MTLRLTVDPPRRIDGLDERDGAVERVQRRTAGSPSLTADEVLSILVGMSVRTETNVHDPKRRLAAIAERVAKFRHLADLEDETARRRIKEAEGSLEYRAREVGEPALRDLIELNKLNMMDDEQRWSGVGFVRESSEGSKGDLRLLREELDRQLALATWLVAVIPILQQPPQ